MPTTTIRMPDELRVRVAATAKRSGTTTHAFILEAIAEKTDAAQRRADFETVAQERYAGLVSSGKTIRWTAMRRYMEARLAGKAARRPAPQKLAR